MAAQYTLKDFGRMRDIHDLAVKPSALPILVKVFDNRQTETNLISEISNGDLLVIRRIQKLSGFIAHPEGSHKHLFIPSSYDGLFHNAPSCHPQADDVNQAMPKGTLRVTRNWRSPYRDADSIYMNDRLRVQGTGYVRAEGNEIEVLICLCRSPGSGEEIEVRIPMEAEGFFEECDAPTGPSFRINTIVDFPTRVVVVARGSPPFLCKHDVFLETDKRMEVLTQVSVSAVFVTNLRTNEGLELLQYAHALKIAPLLSDINPTFPDLEQIPHVKFVHLLTDNQQEAINLSTHPYADLDETQLAAMSLEEPIGAAPQPPPRQPKATVKPMIRSQTKDTKTKDDVSKPEEDEITAEKKRSWLFFKASDKKTRPKPAPRTKKGV